MRTGTRALAFTLAALLLLVFVVAMNEVGTTLPTAAWIHTDGYTYDVAVGARRIAVSNNSDWDRTQDIQFFEVHEQGHATKGRSFRVRAATTASSYKSLMTFETRDRLYVLIQTLRWRDASSADERRLELFCVAPEEGEPRSVGFLELPSAILAPAVGTPIDVAVQNQQLFVLTAVGETSVQALPVVLSTYDLSTVPPRLVGPVQDPGATYFPNQPQLSWQPHFARGADGRIYVCQDRPIHDPCAPDGRIGYPFRNKSGGTSYYFFNGQVVVDADTAASTSPDGLRINLTNLDTYETPVVVCPSLWASLFRSHDGRLIAGRRGQVWEIFNQGRAIGYDVSNPRDPRQIAQIVTLPFREAVASDRLLVFVHPGRSGDWLSVVRLPE